MPPELHSYLPSEPTDFVQIALIWGVLYLFLRVVRGTIAASILRGAVLLVAITLVLTAVFLRAFQLRVVEELFAALGNVAVIAVLVVFQPELRRGLLSLGEHRFLSRLRLRRRAPGLIDDLCAACARLAREK
jgi:diadenylate cyclase